MLSRGDVAISNIELICLNKVEDKYLLTYEDIPLVKTLRVSCDIVINKNN